MGEVNIVKFSLSRTFAATNTKAILFSLVLFIIHIEYSQCYSSVRRSGSGQQMDESKRIQLDSNYIPNISPMLRPANSRTSSPSNQDYNIEIKQIEATKPNVQSVFDSNKNSTEGDGNVLKVDQVESMEKFIEFKPISNEPNLEEFIQKQEEAIQIRTKEEIEDQVHQKLIVKEIGEAIELVTESDLSAAPKKKDKLNQLESELLGYIDQTLSKSTYNLFEGVKIEPVSTLRGRDLNVSGNGAPRSFSDSASDNGELRGFDTQVIEKIKTFAQNHVLSVNLPEAARFFGFKFGQGKSSFLTGFGLGFLAFGLKKLLLPVFIGAQIVKSVLIAMFLPSILGSLGKIVGKGLSQFSGASSNFGQPHVQMDDLDYKDNMGYATENEISYTYPNTDTVGTLPSTALYGNKEDLANVAMSRFGPGGAKVTYLPSSSDNYYRTAYKKQEDYKVFHNIPASSLLLSNYDPFYSPLLSRLDSVFQRLGLGGAQATAPERCREKLVCLMYASPAKYAPYSNLVSAQLSRELNELRKPTSDNPEILRFFRYMKAAKDGQEGGSCSRTYPNCPGLTTDTGSAAMITTYNDINKLVSARKL